MIDWLDVADQRRKAAKENPDDDNTRIYGKDHLRLDFIDGARVRVIATCKCGHTSTTNTPLDTLNRWLGGENIQDVFGSLPPVDREMMVSGVCGKCWDDLFKEEEIPGQ